MSVREYTTPAGEGPPGPNSFGSTTIIVEGEGDTTPRPLPEIAKIWLAHERDRQANPTTPRPYRPYLEPPKPPSANGGTT